MSKILSEEQARKAFEKKELSERDYVRSGAVERPRQVVDENHVVEKRQAIALEQIAHFLKGINIPESKEVVILEQFGKIISLQKEIIAMLKEKPIEKPRKWQFKFKRDDNGFLSSIIAEEEK